MKKIFFKNFRLLQPIYCILLIITCFYCPHSIAQQKKAFDNKKTKSAKSDTLYGVASFYADKFIGKKTSSGELFSQKKLTCAHNTLPFGTMIRVTNLANDSSVVVRVNDRLNQRNPRIVDLSKSAAKKLKFSGRGILKVRVALVNQALEDNMTKTQ